MPNNVHVANSLFEANGRRATACEGNIMNLTWVPTQSMDIIHSNAVFMYLKYPMERNCDDVIQEIHRILRP